MVFRTVVVDDEIMNAVHTGAGKDAVLDFIVNLRIRRSAQDGVHRIFHDAVTCPEDEEGHEGAHDAIDMEAEEIFRQGSHQDTGGGEHVGQGIGTVGFEGLGTYPLPCLPVPPGQNSLARRPMTRIIATKTVNSVSLGWMIFCTDSTRRVMPT